MYQSLQVCAHVESIRVGFIIWTAAELMAVLRYRCPFLFIKVSRLSRKKRPVN